MLPYYNLLFIVLLICSRKFFFLKLDILQADLTRFIIANIMVECSLCTLDAELFNKSHEKSDWLSPQYLNILQSYYFTPWDSIVVLGNDQPIALFFPINVQYNNSGLTKTGLTHKEKPTSETCVTDIRDECT